MIIIGEKINGAIPSTGKAITEKEDKFIRHLVKIQVESGANYLDICAGTNVELELETLKWLIGIVQEETTIPICIDSPNPDFIKEVFPLIKKEGIINSVSMEGNKCDLLFPLIQNTNWNIIALTCDDNGIPESSDLKVKIAFSLIEKAFDYGIAPERIFIDPLVLSLSAINDSMINFMQAVCEIKAKYPTVNITSGLSNISYGMPYRKLINQNFLTLAMSSGMDSAILDPTNRDIYATIKAAEALLNMDKYCKNYNTAYRNGKIGPLKTND